MSDFTFDFNAIQKQLAFANLTEEQIQQLVKTLQSKNTTKSVELPREQKILFQCCREHRSYANNQEIDIVVCPCCGSVHTVENGLVC